MAEYVAYFISRPEVGMYGKTAHEICRGKRATVMAIEFGEKFLRKVWQKNRLEKLNPRWEYGVFVAVMLATKEDLQAVRLVWSILAGETLEPEQQGFRQARPVGQKRRKPGCNMEIFQHHSERPDGTAAIGTTAAGVDGPNLSDCRQHEGGCTHGVLRKTYGHTKGCVVWITVFQARTRQAHTVECRERCLGPDEG